MPEKTNTLSTEQLRVLINIERRVSEFQSVDLANAQNQLQQADHQRQIASNNLNQVQGAIRAGFIFIQRELEDAGVSPEQYEKQKNSFFAESAQIKDSHEHEHKTKSLDEVVRETEQESADAVREYVKTDRK